MKQQCRDQQIMENRALTDTTTSQPLTLLAKEYLERL